MSLALLSCSSSGSDGDDDDDDDDDDPTKSGMCFPDSDGLTGGSYTIALTVTDTGFSKTVINTQNDSMVTLKLTNSGTKPHGFEVGCVSVLSAYPKLPAMCPKQSCFPGATPAADDSDAGTSDVADTQAARIDPIDPGESKTIMFLTPTPDNLIYPFSSNEPDDKDVPGLNDQQWSLM